MEDLHAIVDAVNDSSCVVVIGHVKPDPDAIGAVCAFSLALESLGKKVFRIFQDEIPDDLVFIPSVEKIKNKFPNDENIDLIVICDCSEKKRIGDIILDDTLKKIKCICIDHHISNNKFCSLNLIDSKASATCELMYDLLLKMNVSIDSRIADCLYAGISADSGSFKYSSTTAYTFEIAEKLVKAGANVYEISKELWLNKSKKTIELTKILLDRLSFYFNDKLTISYITLEDREKISADSDHINGFSSVIRDIKGVVLAVFFYEESDYWKMSIRSKDITVSTLKISEFFGGGGHSMASGAKIFKPTTPEKIIESVLELAKDVL